MNKIEIELTDEQLEKVKKLEAEDISIGQAIDMLYEVRNKAHDEFDAIDEKLELLDVDIESKAENLDENYGDSEKTYEMKVQDVKHKVKWGKEIFKF